jgi:hypothetical protein
LSSGGLVGIGVKPASAGNDARLEQRSQQFRIDSGFRSDELYVRQSLSDRERFPVLDYGPPLTQAEGDEIARRIDLQLAATPTVEWAATQPDYGGWYMDQ